MAAFTVTESLDCAGAESAVARPRHVPALAGRGALTAMLKEL
ncbi:hypothetical protein [Streptomyces eurythermus]